MRLRGLTASLALVFLLTFSTLAAQAQEKAASAKHAASTAYDFRALLQRVLDAWSTLDPANAAPFYAHEPGHVFFDFAPMEYDGWAAYAEGVKKAAAAYSSSKITLGRDVRVHKRGNFAWATATWHMALVAKQGGAEQAMDGRWTVLWENRGENWIIVHEHFSVPLQ